MIRANCSSIYTFTSHECKAYNTLWDANDCSLLFLLGQIVAYAWVLIYFVQTYSLHTSHSFVVYNIWQKGVFFQVSFTLGNLNALALSPISQIAGFAASVTGGISTVNGAILASIFNRSFDGTPLPLILSCFLMVFILLRVARHLPVDNQNTHHLTKW